MGRKSDKAREKKKQRKEENAKCAAKQIIVDAANALKDPMAELAPFKKFDRNGLSATISCERVTDMDEELVEWAFQLTKTNMQALYENSDWGWNDKQKKEEMSEEKAWYLLAKDESQKPIAMCHFRFDMDFDDEVLYCYEIQLEKEVRKKGLGKFMMQILALMAHKTAMSKVMVTVFKNNDANRFFKDKLKYEVDETSPEETIAETFYIEDGYSYEILSKPIVPRKPMTQLNGTSNGQS